MRTTSWPGALCQDAYITGKNVEVPILFTTGRMDSIWADGCAEKFYAGVTKASKVLFNIKGAGHFEPSNMGDNSEKNTIAYFFSCWIKGESCDKVCGCSGKEICKTGMPGHILTECKVEGGGPSELTV